MRSRTKGAALSVLLAGLSLLAGLATALLGILAAPIALVAFGALVVYRLGILGDTAPPFPQPSLTLAWPPRSSSCCWSAM
jgi:hypothetical protein